MYEKRKNLKVSKQELTQAAMQTGCSLSQADDLWLLLKKNEPKKALAFLNASYCLGGLILFFTLFWFLAMGMDLYGKNFFFWASLAYACSFYAVGMYLWKAKQKKVPGTIFLFLALCLVPLATFAFELMQGTWEEAAPLEHVAFFRTLSQRFLWIVLNTLIASSVTLYFVRMPLLTVIFYASSLLTLQTSYVTFFGKSSSTVHEGMNILFGIACMVVAYLLDRKNKKDFAFWGYLFGASVFWGSIGGLNYQSEWSYFFYLILNLALIAVGSWVHRWIFYILGSCGIVLYLFQLAQRHFESSLLFPFILSLMGLGIIASGIFYQRKYRIK